ncbi:MAG: hypothetical protein K9M96_13340 [Deltaproteobacteria bacterium]|nr:hypothetical protein [Deltaproteobacteria bacterium]
MRNEAHHHLGQIVGKSCFTPHTIFTVSLLVLLLALTSSCRARLIFTGDPEKEFLGVPWGYSFEELQRILDDPNFPAKLQNIESYRGITTYTFEGNNRFLEHHYGCSISSVYIFRKEKLIDIGVFFWGQNEIQAKNIFRRLRAKIKTELDKVTLDDISSGIDDEEGGKESVLLILGRKGNMSFKLVRGSLDVGLSENTILLTAKNNRTF